MTTSETYQIVLKHLSLRNWEFEQMHIEDILREQQQKYKFEVLTIPSSEVFKGNHNKNRAGYWTIVAEFTGQCPSNDTIAELRWAIHCRYSL